MSDKFTVDEIIKDANDKLAKMFQEGERPNLTKELKANVVKKLAEHFKEVETPKLKEARVKAEADTLIRLAKQKNETGSDKFRRYFIGPFQFLAFSLIMSEGLLLYWMSKINAVLNADPITVPISVLDTIYYERTIVGSLFIAVLIAVLVVFSIVYKIKNNHGDCEH